MSETSSELQSFLASYFNGQHRKRAIHELIEGRETELIGNNDFPIILVLKVTLVNLLILLLAL
jgi:hypothetical protein